MPRYDSFVSANVSGGCSALATPLTDEDMFLDIYYSLSDDDSAVEPSPAPTSSPLLFTSEFFPMKSDQDPVPSSSQPAVAAEAAAQIGKAKRKRKRKADEEKTSMLIKQCVWALRDVF
ncbi:hypothetical protein EON65_13235 [archaeon]|nr:MAG: hypothetical protein EON65_13235 [archaeon]